MFFTAKSAEDAKKNKNFASSALFAVWEKGKNQR